MSAYDTVLVERNGPVTTIVINRPEVRNAVDDATADRLLAAFEAFESDDDACVAVLAGAGTAFCAGADLKDIAAGKRRPRGADDPGALGPTRLVLSKPVIAAVAGPAVAGGLELALWCDLRVVEETAYFGVFCRRWGVPLLDGGTVRLPRLIGASHAMDMIVTGRRVDAREARAMGLANRLVPEGRARIEAERLAREIAQFPQLCMRADRLAAHRQWSLSLEDALRMEALGGAGARAVEAIAGASRFAAGRGRHGAFETS